MGLQIVRQYGLALRYVPEALRTPELCLAAVQQSGNALRWVPELLRTPELCRIAGRPGILDNILLFCCILILIIDLGALLPLFGCVIGYVIGYVIKRAYCSSTLAL